MIGRLLLRHWFLLLLLAGAGLAWLVPESLRPWTGRLSPRAIVAPALFLMAWGLESRSLVRAFLHPLPALWAVAISYGALPTAVWLIVFRVWDGGVTDLRIGLMVCASVPCTLASAVLWTRMAGGSEATALLVVLLTTSTSWLVTTAWLALATGAAVQLDAAGMMRELLLVLVLPVGLGQLVRTSSSMVRAATRYRSMIGVVSRLLILVILLKAAVDVCGKLQEGSSGLGPGSLLMTAGMCLGLHLTALTGGFWSSKVLGFDRPSQVAVAFACSQKTLPVALFLFDTFYQNDYPLAVVPMVLYHAGQLIVDTFIATSLASGNRTPTPADGWA